jgi:hypothetical protein
VGTQEKVDSKDEWKRNIRAKRKHTIFDPHFIEPLNLHIEKFGATHIGFFPQYLFSKFEARGFIFGFESKR